MNGKRSMSNGPLDPMDPLDRRMSNGHFSCPLDPMDIRVVHWTFELSVGCIIVKHICNV